MMSGTKNREDIEHGARNMQYITFFFRLVILCLSTLCVAGNSLAKEKYVLIYNGPTTCNGCPEAIADIAKMAKLPVKFVSVPKKIPELLPHAAVFVIGGTEDNIEPMRQAFTNPIVFAIQEYLKKGGRYLGICGGGFIAAKHYMVDKMTLANGFNIIPAYAVDYSETSKAHLEKIRWYGKKEILYFQGGPKFFIDHYAKSIKVIATYKDGSIAAFDYPYGQGRVAVVGPHPEADKSWLKEDKINSHHWHTRQNLAVNLLQNLIAE